MRIPNDSGAPEGGPIAEMLRLQAQFQARLANDTLNYLRGLQGLLGPASPGTVVACDQSFELAAAGAAGSTVELRYEVENRQGVHCVVSPALSPLVDDRGTTWFPALWVDPITTVLGPDEVAEVVLRLPLPPELPAGTYHGALILEGFRSAGIPVTIKADQPAPPVQPDRGGGPGPTEP